MDSYDHAHTARIDDDRYAQRSMVETVNSAVKRSLGSSSERVLGIVSSMNRTDVCSLQHQTLGETVKSAALQRFNTALDCAIQNRLGNRGLLFSFPSKMPVLSSYHRSIL